MIQIPDTIFSCTIELTYQCNFRCMHCYIDNHNPVFFNTDRLDALIEFLNAFEMQRVYLFGGEPLLHNDFIKIYRTLFLAGFQMSLSTNGSLINKEIVELFEKMPPINLWVSLYGYSSESYYKFTNTNAFERIRRNLAQLDAHRIHYHTKYIANRHSFPVGITKQSICDAFSLKMDQMTVYANIIPTLGGCMDNQCIKLTEFDKFARGLLDSVEPVPYSKGCSPYNYGFVVAPDGSVRSCVQVKDTSKVNIFLNTYTEIYCQVKADHIEQYFYPEECHDCNKIELCKCPIL